MECPNCDGTGLVTMEIWSVQSHKKINEIEVECPQCKGVKTVEDATKPTQLVTGSPVSDLRTGTTEEILLLECPSSDISSGET